MTRKLEVFGTEVLALPTVEFILELDVAGKLVTLLPSDFDVKGVGSQELRGAVRTEITLMSKRDKFPLVLHIRYLTDPRLPYIQKTLAVKPLKKMPGAILKRVTIDELSLKPEFAVSANNFIAVDPKSGKGIYFFVAALLGVESLTRYGALALLEETDHPLEASYETNPAVLGTALGGANGLSQGFTDFLRQRYCAAPTRNNSALCVDVTPDTVGDLLNKNAQRDFEKRCKALRQSSAGQPLCLAVDAKLLPRFVHLLSVVDILKIDCSKADFREYRLLRCWALRVFPRSTVRFTPPSISEETLVPEAKAIIISSMGDELPAVEKSSAAASYVDKARSFREKFAGFLKLYQPILECSAESDVNGEAHLIGSSGFFIVYNSAEQPRRVVLPLDAPHLGLKGELSLSDWTALDVGTHVRTVAPSEKVELEVGPRSALIIGVNIDLNNQAAEIPVIRSAIAARPAGHNLNVLTSK